MENFYSWLVAALVVLFFVVRYWIGHKKRETAAIAAAEHGKLFSDGPKAQHPHINLDSCIGCGTCVDACPEGDVLGLLNGKATIVKGHKCIGPSICAEVCPVGAITMVMAKASASSDMPALTPQFETTIPNLFIVGELGGLALIKNAVNQGRECIDLVAKRIAERQIPGGPGFGATTGGQKSPGHAEHAEIYDVLIVGAGPGGISASLRAIERKLSYVTLERDEVGGTVAKYPRQKLVMTSPVEFPMYGKFKKTELSKEHLLAFWDMILNRADFNVRTSEKVEDIQKEENGIFTVSTATNQYRSRAVVLALGRAGEPRKLGVTGEELPKVMYRLIEADHYVNKRILVVGGGDSAVEAAMGLASQLGNWVALSYRQERFGRIKERNAKRIEDFMRTGKLKVLFNSNPVEFKPETVILEVKGEVQEIANDFVWIFAGGTPPNDFLKKIGVGFGSRDLTLEASTEAKQAILAKKQSVQANAAGVK